MLKPLVLVSAAIVLAGAAAPISGRMVPKAAPSQSAAPAQAPAPVTGPMPLDATNPVKPTAASQAQAKVIYERDCSMCHGDNGNGKTDLATSMELKLTDWTGPKALADRRDGELFDIIRAGRGKMPPEETGRASDDVVWNMIVYIRGLSKPQATTAANSPN